MTIGIVITIIIGQLVSLQIFSVPRKERKISLIIEAIEDSETGKTKITLIISGKVKFCSQA